MSPIAVERGFTERFLEEGDVKKLEKRILESYEKVSRDKDLVIIEGTGHAGVGAVFGLHNARVARLLNAKVLLITVGGIGRPFDEIMLNKALFEKEGVEIVGVVVNKVLPEKMEKITRVLSRALDKEGLRMFGAVPFVKTLSSPTFAQICEALQGEIISDRGFDRRVDNIVVGAMAPHGAISYFTPGSLIITPGDREDIILATMAKAEDIVGLVLTCGVKPHPVIMELVKKASFPVIVVASDTYTTTSRIHDLVVKVRPQDRDKISMLNELVREYVDVEGIYNAI